MSVQNEVEDLSPWIKYSTGRVSLFERIGESIQAGARDVDDIAMAMFGDVINNWVASADASVETMEQRLGSELSHSMNVIVDLTSNEARISPYSLPKEHEVNLCKLWLMEDGEIQVFWHGEGRIPLSALDGAPKRAVISAEHTRLLEVDGWADVDAFLQLVGEDIFNKHFHDALVENNHSREDLFARLEDVRDYLDPEEISICTRAIQHIKLLDEKLLTT